MSKKTEKEIARAVDKAADALAPILIGKPPAYVTGFVEGTVFILDYFIKIFEATKKGMKR
jgi:hypothetical protein